MIILRNKTEILIMCKHSQAWSFAYTCRFAAGRPGGDVPAHNERLTLYCKPVLFPLQAHDGNKIDINAIFFVTFLWSNLYDRSV